MPMFVKGPGGDRRDAVGIPLELLEWSEYQGEVAAAGRRLDCGHEDEIVAVILSTRDRHAANQNRRSLGEWRDGYRALGQEFRLQVGGIALFRNCRPLEADASVFVSTWVNVFACTPEETAQVCQAEHAVMRVFTSARTFESRPGRSGSGAWGGQSQPASSKSPSGPRHWGDVVVFYADSCVLCVDESAAQEETFRLASLRELREPMFLVRGVNEDGEVVASSQVALSRRQVNIRGRTSYALPRAEDLANAVREHSAAIRNHARSVAAFNLLPAARWLLSPRTFFSPQRVEGTVSVSRAFRQRDSGQEVYVAKEVLFKLSELSDDDAQFVNAIHPVDPFGNGCDVDLLGELKYANDANLSAVRVGKPADLSGSESTVSEKAQAAGGLKSTHPWSGERGEPRQPHRRVSNSGTRVPQRPIDPPEDPFAGIPTLRPRRRL